MSVLRKGLPVAALALAASVIAACGEQTINLPANESPEIRHGAELFSQRCAGCHTLDVAATHGSGNIRSGKQSKDGPNFNFRKVTKDNALYAIRNGGFSSLPMPQNIVVGKDAEDVAAFLDKYSGAKAPKIPTP